MKRRASTRASGRVAQTFPSARSGRALRLLGSEHRECRRGHQPRGHGPCRLPAARHLGRAAGCVGDLWPAVMVARPSVDRAARAGGGVAARGAVAGSRPPGHRLQKRTDQPDGRRTRPGGCATDEGGTLSRMAWGRTHTRRCDSCGPTKRAAASRAAARRGARRPAEWASLAR